MEGYLRLSLLVLGAVVVFFVLLEMWQSRRSQFKVGNNTAQRAENEEVREPRMMGTGFAAIDEDDDFALDSVSAVRISSGYDGDDEAVIESPVVTKAEAPVESPAVDLANDIVVLTVVAQPGHEFSSYDLLHAIYAAGFEFGDMNIFHYYDNTAAGQKAALFSLASATEPGEFDLDRIGNYSCSGLTLFTVLSNVNNPRYAFDLMLRAAEQLADDLNGELRAGPRKAWDRDVHQQYLQKVLHYQLKTHA